jgi:hypothetical protein
MSVRPDPASLLSFNSGFRIGNQQTVYGHDVGNGHSVFFFWRSANVVADLNFVHNPSEKYPTARELAQAVDPDDLQSIENLSARMETHIRLALTSPPSTPGSDVLGWIDAHNGAVTAAATLALAIVTVFLVGLTLYQYVAHPRPLQEGGRARA